MIEFQDEEINKLDLDGPPDQLSKLIVTYLCGKEDIILTNSDIRLLTNLVSNAKKNKLNYKQLNELLLLLNQDTIDEGFFKFFFEKDLISIEELKKGIIKFRGYAMLCFGNFRFAFKDFARKSFSQINELISEYCIESDVLKSNLKRRREKMLEIETISRDKTWLLGVISGIKVDKEGSVLEEKLRKGENGDLLIFRDKLTNLSIELERIQEIAFRNTAIYLTWDYMDIYVATSMRNKWEFEETYDFIQVVFEDGLSDLNLRYFDPTQSKCRNVKDKGLMEGLMLKRAKCTIYLAQESDTMGKDSELATTLAQSKPVIVYVPNYNPFEYAKIIEKYPLEYFKKRLLILDAEEVFEEKDFIQILNENYFPDYESIINNFLKELRNHRDIQPFILWDEKEDEFKRNYEELPKLSQILALAECYNFNKRADLLKGKHPLSMQIHLLSGVSNGVLVVRTPLDCAKLLERILTNNMKFTIKKEEGYTTLYEEISNSPFRVVTDNKRLTNSFWNFYL